MMCIFFLFGGMFPIIPYLIFPFSQAWIFSIIITSIVLFTLGVGVSRLTKRSAIKTGLEMVVISLCAAGVGFIVGRIVSSWVGVEII
jgi:predicted membrane protein (TIGR00267 family)